MRIISLKRILFLSVDFCSWPEADLSFFPFHQWLSLPRIRGGLRSAITVSASVNSGTTDDMALG